VASFKSPSHYVDVLRKSGEIFRINNVRLQPGVSKLETDVKKSSGGGGHTRQSEHILKDYSLMMETEQDFEIIDICSELTRQSLENLSHLVAVEASNLIGVIPIGSGIIFPLFIPAVG
jgi:hypothetical protein